MAMTPNEMKDKDLRADDDDKNDDSENVISSEDVIKVSSESLT